MTFSRQLVLAALLFLASSAAYAAFDGDYDVANWTQTPDGGIIDVSGAPASVAFTSASGGSAADTLMSIALAATGTLSFDWNYNTSDNNTQRDPFGYYLNGAYTKLTANGGGPNKTQSGSVSFAVTVGDSFSFSLQSTNGNAATAAVSVSNFSAPAAVPLPPSLVLFAFAIATLLFIRQRRRAVPAYS